MWIARRASRGLDRSGQYKLCPPLHRPASPNTTPPHSHTGNKYGACGPFSGLEQYGRNGVTKLRPGPLTVTWEESVAHKGSPFRIAILDAEENVRMVL